MGRGAPAFGAADSAPHGSRDAPDARSAARAQNEAPQIEGAAEGVHGGVIIPPDWNELGVHGCFRDLLSRMVEERAANGAGVEFFATPVFTIPGLRTEFQPPTTQAAVDYHNANLEANEPATTRLMLAISTDGVRWTKTGLVVANCGSVPALAVEDDVLYLYYQGLRGDAKSPGMMRDVAGDDLAGTPGSVICVASSRDLLNWTYRVIGDDGVGIEYGPDAPAPNAADPSVVRGTAGWLLYYTLHWDELGRAACGEDPTFPYKRAATFVADAARLDDFYWTQRAARVFPVNVHEASAEDPSVLMVHLRDGTYFYQYAAAWIAAAPDAPTGSPSGWLAMLDADGQSLLAYESIRPTCSDREVRLDNPLLPEVVVRKDGTSVTWLASVRDPNDKAFEPYTITVAVTPAECTAGAVSTDGGSACAPVLEADEPYEVGGIFGTATAMLMGCYVMVYQTGVPGAY